MSKAQADTVARLKELLGWVELPAEHPVGSPTRMQDTIGGVWIVHEDGTVSKETLKTTLS